MECLGTKGILGKGGVRVFKMLGLKVGRSREAGMRNSATENGQGQNGAGSRPSAGFRLRKFQGTRGADQEEVEVEDSRCKVHGWVNNSGDGEEGKVVEVVVVVVGVAVKDRPCFFEGTSVGGKVRQPAGESRQHSE